MAELEKKLCLRARSRQYGSFCPQEMAKHTEFISFQLVSWLLHQAPYCATTLQQTAAAFAVEHWLRRSGVALPDALGVPNGPMGL